MGLQVSLFIPLPDVCPSFEQTAPFFGVAAFATVARGHIGANKVAVAKILMTFNRTLRTPLMMVKSYSVPSNHLSKQEMLGPIRVYL